MDIAILDSGINPWHSHVQKIKGGLGFFPQPGDKVAVTPDCCDHLGHGTAIAALIRHGAPSADLYAFKIFHQTLHCSATILLEALAWAIEADIKLIHLSLGTVHTQYKSDLADLVAQAHEKDIILVAAARNDGDIIYPAAFETVIGVYWHPACPKDKVYYDPDKAVAFGAYGRPRRLPGKRPEENFAGNSFAAARVSAMAARILTEHPRAAPANVRDRLAQEFGIGVTT